MTLSGCTIRQVMLLLALAGFFALAATRETIAQRTPRATDKGPAPTTTSTPPKRIVKIPRRDPTIATKAPASVESDKFIELGNGFREKQMWNAAEAAYNEATKVWSNNGEAYLLLGYLYLDEKNPDLGKKVENARGVLSKLRSINSAHAASLSDAIAAFQNQINH